MRFLVSLDVGQAHDYSAALVTRRVGERIHITSVDRAPLRTAYPAIAHAVLGKCAELEPTGVYPVGLAVDAGGVGRAVSDLLRAEIASLPATAPEIKFYPVSSTSGSRTTTGAGSINVPKRDLVSSAVVALQRGLIRIGDIENADLLVRELREFRVSLNATGHESYSGSGRNDDCASALMLASWAWSQIPATETGPSTPRRSWGSRGASSPAQKPRKTGAGRQRSWGKR